MERIELRSLSAFRALSVNRMHGLMGDLNLEVENGAGTGYPSQGKPKRLSDDPVTRVFLLGSRANLIPQMGQDELSGRLWLQFLDGWWKDVCTFCCPILGWRCSPLAHFQD